MMKKIFTGSTVVVGDNVDTDQIYPGCYLALTDPKEIGSHGLAGIDEQIARTFPKGGIIVAGKNFGCGSSREHAVVADSFARIFFRNSINLGLPLIVSKEICGKIKTGQSMTIDLEKGMITVLESGQTYRCDRLGDQAMKILDAGGIKPLMKKRFLTKIQ